MKNQYFGDIGDYGKYALLRTFAQNGITIAVNWYLTDNIPYGGAGYYDGKYIQYLKKEKNQQYCPEVFQLLRSAVIDQDIRDVRVIENSDVIPHARYFNEPLPVTKGISKEERAKKREEWHQRGLAFCEGADLAFLDPDNGLREALTKSPKMDRKYVLREEAAAYYRAGSNLVYYCHKGRRSDEKWSEYKKLLQRTDLPDAVLFGLTFHRGTQRTFLFVVHPEVAGRYREIADGFLESPWKKDGLFSLETIE